MNDDLQIIFFDSLEHETDLAYLLRFDEEKIWLPKSQVKDFDVLDRTLSIPRWLMEEKGLEGYNE